MPVILANCPALLPRAPLAACAALLLLAGCSYQMEKVDNPVNLPVTWDTPPTEAQPAAAQAAAALPATAPAVTAAASAPPQDWWLAFGSPVLTQLIEEALTGNPSVKIAEERVKQAERALSVSRDQLLP